MTKPTFGRVMCTKCKAKCAQVQMLQFGLHRRPDGTATNSMIRVRVDCHKEVAFEDARIVNSILASGRDWWPGVYSLTLETKENAP